MRGKLKRVANIAAYSVAWLADAEKSVQTRIVLIHLFPKKLRQTAAGTAAAAAKKRCGTCMHRILFTLKSALIA
jgi:hypothetical protein